MKQNMQQKIIFYLKLLILFIVIVVFTRYIRITPYNFVGFNNETGLSSYIVPNIIHFIRFNKSEFSFVDIVVIRAAHLVQKPDAIYIHTDLKQFHGKYWLQLQQKWPDTFKLLQIKQRQIPTEVFGRSLNSGYKLWHASDIIRYRLLKEYGGIYFDNDVFLIHSLDRYRKFEMTIEWNQGEFIGNQVLIGHKDARFLSSCVETFRDYRSDLWYYNGGELPTTAVLYKHPEFIHRVMGKFGTNTGVSYLLFAENSARWKDFDAIHLLVNHRSYMYKENFKKYPEFNEDMILNYNFTFGEMMRSIYFGS